MRREIVELLLVLLMVNSALCAKKTQPSLEKLENCVKEADRNANSVFIVPQLEEIFKQKPVAPINPDLTALLFMECDEIADDVHMVLTKAGCGKDLERQLVEGKVTALPRLAHVMAMRDFCIDYKINLGLF